MKNTTQGIDQWKSAVDDALSTFLYTTDNFKTAKDAIDKLISLNVDIATDPLVNGNRVLVDRKDIQLWRVEWMEEHDAGDDVDVVTPFDHYLY